MRRYLQLYAALSIAATSLSACVHEQETQVSIGHPDSTFYGSSLASMTAKFDSKCQNYEVRELDPATLPIAETSHVQVDCHGFSHAGAKRLAEFVFADDRLAFIWVLTEVEEEPALLQLLLDTYGSPTHDTPLFVAFADDYLALRRDTPELLYYSEAVAPLYRSWFDQSAASQ